VAVARVPLWTLPRDPGELGTCAFVPRPPAARDLRGMSRGLEADGTPMQPVLVAGSGPVPGGAPGGERRLRACGLRGGAGPRVADLRHHRRAPAGAARDIGLILRLRPDPAPCRVFPHFGGLAALTTARKCADLQGVARGTPRARGDAHGERTVPAATPLPHKCRDLVPRGGASRVGLRGGATRGSNARGESRRATAVRSAEAQVRGASVRWGTAMGAGASVLMLARSGTTADEDDGAVLGAFLGGLAVVGGLIGGTVVAVRNESVRRAAYSQTLGVCLRPALLTATLGPDHPEVASSLRVLAFRYSRVGDLARGRAAPRAGTRDPGEALRSGRAGGGDDPRGLRRRAPGTRPRRGGRRARAARPGDPIDSMSRANRLSRVAQRRAGVPTNWANRSADLLQSEVARVAHVLSTTVARRRWMV
jgi:hypothetical protein